MWRPFVVVVLLSRATPPQNARDKQHLLLCCQPWHGASAAALTLTLCVVGSAVSGGELGGERSRRPTWRPSFVVVVLLSRATPPQNARDKQHLLLCCQPFGNATTFRPCRVHNIASDKFGHDG